MCDKWYPWDQMAMAYFKVLSCSSSEGNEDNRFSAEIRTGYLSDDSNASV
jgi:hypothetical protein